MTEQWRPIPGYEGRYEASDHGRVRSVWASTGPKILWIRPAKGGHRYPSVVLYKDRKRREVLVHHAVVRAFRGPAPDGMQIRHLDGDTSNALLSNLVYGTPSENMYDKVRHGRNFRAEQTECKYGHPYTEENTLRRVRGRECATCRRARKRAYYYRDRAALLEERAA